MISSQPVCDSLAAEVKVIRSFKWSHNAIKGIVRSDSLLEAHQELDPFVCMNLLWLRFERAECLELNKDYEEAIEAYFSIISSAEAIKHWGLVVEGYISLARAYEIIGRKEDCVRNLSLAFDLIKAHGLKRLESRYYIRASSYLRIFENNRDSAKTLALKAIEMGRTHKRLKSVVDGHLLMGVMSEKDTIGIYHLTKAANYFDSLGDNRAAGFMENNLASLYLERGDTDKALKLIPKIKRNANAINPNWKSHHDVMGLYHDQLNAIFLKKNQFDSAYHHLSKSLTHERQAIRLVDQERIDQKTIEFSLRKEKQEALALRRKAQFHKIIIGLLGLLGLISILFLYGSFRNKSKIAEKNALIIKRNEELSTSLHKQSLLLSEVHHRVKNNLQLVISLLDLKSSRYNNTDVILGFEDISRKVRSIALIHEQLYSQGEFEHVNLHNYLTDLCKHYNELNLNGRNVVSRLDIKDVFLNIETVLPLGLITSELLSNSFKYAVRPHQKLEIEISVESLEEMYVFKYRDNGPGYNPTISKNSKPIGMNLISKMVRQLMAISETYNKDGAVFTMTFKEKKVSAI